MKQENKMVLLVYLWCLIIPISGSIYGNYSGDIVLAGFFPVHAHTLDEHGLGSCGDIQEQDGVQPMETFFHTLDEINNSDLLPGFTLGGVVADSCDDDSHALQQAVDLIRVLMTRVHPDDSPYICRYVSSVF